MFKNGNENDNIKTPKSVTKNSDRLKDFKLLLTLIECEVFCKEYCRINETTSKEAIKCKDILNKILVKCNRRNWKEIRYSLYANYTFDPPYEIKEMISKFKRKYKKEWDLLLEE